MDRLSWSRKQLNRIIGCSLTCTLAFGCIFWTATAQAYSIYQPGTTGVDVSWPPPNCSAKPPTYAAFGIVGVTGGLDYTQNSCLITEASWFHNLSLYMNTGYPGVSYALKYATYPRHCSKTDENCLAYNYGFDAANYALIYAASRNVHSTVWWLDVETENSWTAQNDQNVSSIQGMIDAIRLNTFLPTIGIYSTPNQWRTITGGWQLNLPNWVGTGSGQKSAAVSACSANNFTGSGTWLTQYTTTLDHDYVCQQSPSSLNQLRSSAALRL